MPKTIAGLSNRKLSKVMKDKVKDMTLTSTSWNEPKKPAKMGCQMQPHYLKEVMKAAI